MAKLFFIGDSITAGAWDAQGGWVMRLMGKIMDKTRTSERKFKGFYCMPYNLGVSGDTAPDVLRRMKNEVTARVYGGAADDTVQFIFAFGVNDSVYSLEENKNYYTDEEFQDDVARIISLAKIYTNNISFIGLLPVDETCVNPVPWAPERAYKNDCIKHFNTMLSSLCEANDVAFLDLFYKWKTMTDYQDYLSDGLHPNSAGHELMAQQIGEFLLTSEFEKFHTK